MISGRCSCGRISYSCNGPPLFQIICCCADCQRASGSSHVPVLGVNKNQFTVTGSTKTYVCTGGSGKNAVRHFCPDCGSLLFGTPEVADYMVTIYAGTLDDTSKFHPTAAIFTRSKMHWELFDENIKQFASAPN
jgi:hypothetical protein